MVILRGGLSSVEPRPHNQVFLDKVTFFKSWHDQLLGKAPC